jgi:phage baseplate assembly protein gpV
LQDGNKQYPMYHCIGRHAAPAGFPSGTSWGFKDPAGNILKVDLAAQTVRFATSTGVVFAVDASGNLAITVPGTTTVNATGDVTVNAQHKVTVVAQEEADVTSSTKVKLTAPNIELNGNVDSTGTFKNNGVNIGSTHKHGGVTTGGGQTAVPV